PHLDDRTIDRGDPAAVATENELVDRRPGPDQATVRVPLRIAFLVLLPAAPQRPDVAARGSAPHPGGSIIVSTGKNVASVRTETDMAHIVGVSTEHSDFRTSCSVPDSGIVVRATCHNQRIIRAEGRSPESRSQVTPDGALEGEHLFPGRGIPHPCGVAPTARD